MHNAAPTRRTVSTGAGIWLRLNEKNEQKHNKQ